MDPLIKICLDQPSTKWAKLIVVASRSYHTIKFDHRETVEQAILTGDFEPMAAILCEVVAHFCSEFGVT